MSHTAFLNIECLKSDLKDSSVRFRMKLSILRCSESYSVETKRIEVNVCPFSCNQAYYYRLK